MPSDKDGFVSYKSHFKVLEHLSDEQLGKLSRAVYHYQISGIEPEKDSPIYFPFAFMKLSFDSDDIKYQAVIERNKSNGSKGGRPTGNPVEPKKPNGLSGNPVEPKKADKDKDKDKGSSSEDGKGSLSADLQARLAALTDTSGEVRWNASILSKPDYFAKVAAKLDLGSIDVEHYRKAALLVAEADDTHRAIKGWESWVANYFTNQKQRGPLLPFDAAMPTVPTPSDQMPAPGKERAGQIIAISCAGQDDSMRRMKVAAYQQHFPTAIIHPIF